VARVPDTLLELLGAVLRAKTEIEWWIWFVARVRRLRAERLVSARTARRGAVSQMIE